MKRLCMALAVAGLAAFTLSAVAQPQDGDRPRDGGDRAQRGDRGPGRPGGPGRFGPGGPGGFRFPPPPVMVALDADKDGALSTEEIAKASEALKTLDKDKDGKLSAEELRPERPNFGGRGGPGGPGRDRGRFNPEEFVNRFMENDADKDGKLTEEELPERMRRFTSRWDENDDGVIEKSEVEAAAARFGQDRRGDRDGGPRGPRDGDRPRGDGPRDGDAPSEEAPGDDDAPSDAPSSDDL